MNKVKSTNTIYQLKEEGLYSESKLKSLLKKEPDNMLYIIGYYTLLREKGLKDKADKLISESLPLISNLEDKKWLEAYIYQLEYNENSYQRAIDLMEESLVIFDKKYKKLDNNLKEKKSELLFRYSLIHYDYGQFVFSNNNLSEDTLLKSIEQFIQALEKHKMLRQFDNYPFSQMDFANIHYWLALLHLYLRKLKIRFESDEEDIRTLANIEKKYWECFIEESHNTIFYNYRESVKDYPFNPAQTFYSEAFLINNYSFLGLGYARLAELEKNFKDKKDYLRHGELIFAEHTPLKIEDPNTRYRFYFNYANFYSIKAQILNEFSINGDKTIVGETLDYCYKGLYQAYKNNKDSFMNEITEIEEVYFYKQNRDLELKKLIEEDLIRLK